MAEDRQPPTVVEGATTGVDVDDEVPAAAKSAEDRKAADALSKLDARGDDDGAAPAREVDQEAVSRAMNQLGGDKKVEEEKKDVKKIKVDPADVALLTDQLDLHKVKATELLRAHDGDAVKAMTAFVTPSL